MLCIDFSIFLLVYGIEYHSLLIVDVHTLERSLTAMLLGARLLLFLCSSAVARSYSVSITERRAHYYDTIKSHSAKVP